MLQFSEKQSTGSNLSERNDREQGNSDFEASIEENPGECSS